MNERDAAAISASVAAGSRAAAALARACDSSMAADGSARLKLHLETVRDAALDLERQLDSLADGNTAPDAPGLLAEGALRCADTANLAACAIPELPAEAVPAAVAASHLSAGAARALQPIVEAAEEDRAEYAPRDARNAAWRANLVVQQVEEALSSRSHGGQDE